MFYISLFNQTRPLVDPPIGVPVAPIPIVVDPVVPLLVAPVDASDVSLVVPPEVQEISIKLQNTKLAGSQQSRLALVAPVESGTSAVVPSDVQDISANTHAIIFIGSQQSRVGAVDPVESVVPSPQSTSRPNNKQSNIPDTLQQSMLEVVPSVPLVPSVPSVPSVTPVLAPVLSSVVPVVVPPVVISLEKMEYFLSHLDKNIANSE